MSDLCVFSTGIKPLLRQSCADHGIELHEYGVGRPWPGMCVGKITEPLAFLKTRTEKYALFTDGEDSFIVNDEDHIIGEFEANVSRWRPILISAEKNCYPDPELAEQYPESPTPWKYINAGGWMGKREALIMALGELQDSPFFGVSDDQLCWHHWFLRYRYLADLDSGCEVFQTMAGTDEFIPPGMNTLTLSCPSVIHFNGRTGMDGRMEQWYERLK